MSKTCLFIYIILRKASFITVIVGSEFISMPQYHVLSQTFMLFEVFTMRRILIFFGKNMLPIVF